MSSVTLENGSSTHSRGVTPSPSRDPDAGLRTLPFYERRLPKWRYNLRRWLIPIVRWETPYLARVQTTCRSHILDSYFALTANLGTHTFFMAFLPMSLWLGYPEFGIAVVHMLALGVVLSGILKDIVCLPRPLSPPLQRITMSGSAALEYGWPSTHTTNAVSVALFSLYQLYLSRNDWDDTTFNTLRVVCYCYAVSISLGRMYCGMHGLFDVVCGGALGAFITWLRITYGQTYDQWLLAGSWTRPALAVLVFALIVRFHPEPADNCPCFDDSVSFLGVVMGLAIGTWHYGQLQERGWRSDPSLHSMYPYSTQDITKSAMRLIGGIVVIFLWRALMKPLLLGCLPPIFRFVDRWGVRMPRRYFLQARNYTSVPPLREDDNVLPSASEIPSLLSSIRHPRRRRVSVGPQSEADAREFLANRQRKRQDRSSKGSPSSTARSKLPTSPDEVASPGKATEPPEPMPDAAVNTTRKGISTSSLQVKSMKASLLTPPASDAGASSDSGKEDKENDRELFARLEKPRVRYDVEVITKLVVYAGIGWLAVEGNPYWFELLGVT